MLPNRSRYAALGLAALLVGCGGTQEADPVVRPVSAVQVSLGSHDAARTFSGTAQTDKTINLSFRNSGIITLFEMSLGRRVRRGQLLAQLDNVQARLAHEQALSSLNSAESQMNTAALSYERVRLLYEKGSASLSQFESAKNSFRTAEASYQSAQRSVQIQEEQVRYGFIYAPETGTIASVQAELDENVNAGQLVAVLNAGSRIEIALGLPESVINQVDEAQEVEISFSALPGEEFSGVVTEISPSLDPQSATFPVRVAVMNASSGVRPGMTASVRFNWRSDSAGGGALVVPAKAVGEDADGRFVFVIEREADGPALARKRRVNLGSLSSNGFLVLDGLAEGDLIATAGLQTLLDGQPVRVN